jgi:hypothetical protein
MAAAAVVKALGLKFQALSLIIKLEELKRQTSLVRLPFLQVEAAMVKQEVQGDNCAVH